MTEDQEQLVYWIRHRYAVFLKKEKGLAKPWSDDPIFQRTYFCNVHRENDRVTKWIREFYSPYVDHPNFTAAMCRARLFNWPPTLAALGFPDEWDVKKDREILDSLAAQGKVWGNAYVVTTHGRAMSKLDYACEVLQAAHEWLAIAALPGSCSGAHRALQQLEGFGSFMAAQVVADLKNTPGHPLHEAKDWWTFSAPGPGSLRGLSWYYGFKITPSKYKQAIKYVMHEITPFLDGIPPICEQDLQNCLCEYDKYMRVNHGTGRSKRIYNGRN